MYIRRKVFSLLQDETGEERYYSTTDFDLDVEERVFAEAEEEPKKGLSKGAKIGIGVGGGLAATAAGIIGAKYAGKQLVKKSNKALEELKQQIKKEGFTEELKNTNNKLFKKQVLGKKLAAPADYITKGAKMAVEKTKGVFSKKK